MTVNLIVGMGFLLILLGLTVLDTRSKRAHEFRMAQLDRQRPQFPPAGPITDRTNA